MAQAAAAARLAWQARAWAPRPLRRRVTLGWELATVAAWVALIALVASGTMASLHHGADAIVVSHDHPPGMHGTPGAHHLHHVHAAVGGGAAMAMWALMSVAMMLPAALPAIAHVGVNSLRRRRGRAMATFALAYLAIWIAFGGLLLALTPLWAPLPDGLVLGGALALAAAWQLTMWKRRALNACHRSWPLPPSGWRATAGAARFGLRNGAACVGSCWALMLTMAVAGGAMLGWMVALTAIVVSEKLAPRPRRPTRAAAALLATAAAMTTAVALV